jgi:hypothetical protein
MPSEPPCQGFPRCQRLLETGIGAGKVDLAQLGVGGDEQGHLDDVLDRIALRFKLLLDLVQDADGLGLGIAEIFDRGGLGRIDGRGELAREEVDFIAGATRTPSRMKAFGLVLMRVT